MISWPSPHTPNPCTCGQHVLVTVLWLLFHEMQDKPEWLCIQHANHAINDKKDKSLTALFLHGNHLKERWLHQGQVCVTYTPFWRGICVTCPKQLNLKWFLWKKSFND